MNIEELWAELEAETLLGPGHLRRRVRADSERDLFIGVMLPNRERVLELAVTTEAADDLRLPATRALKILQEPSPPAKVEIRIVLAAPEMTGVFTPFCEDVIQAVAVSPDDRAAVSTLLERFTHWQRLFAAEGGGLSSLEAQALFGELWVLENVLLQSTSHRSIESWRGPEQENRDFLLNGLGIEVKTTRSQEPTFVTISSEAQLNTAGLETLYLIAIKLEVLEGGQGATLIDLVASVRRALAPEAISRFDDKLLRYGYVDQDADRYSDVVYVVREVAAFEVTDGFPRIIESDLVTGVGGVIYRLGLAACEPWRQNLDALSAAVVRAESGGQR